MSDHKLDTCGCCEGKDRLTPVNTYNRPGLNALSFRVGTHPAFFETMLADLGHEVVKVDTVDIDGRKDAEEYRPLKYLKTRRRDEFSIALLDVWAIIADVLAFYQERIANEGYLRTATERRSILELARLVGYELKPGVAASTFLAFTIEESDKPAFIPKGTRAQSVPEPGETMQTFETMHDLEARYTYNELKLRLMRPQFLRPSQLIDNPPPVLYLPGVHNDLHPSTCLLLAFGIKDLNATSVFDDIDTYHLVQVKKVDLLDQPVRTAVELQPEPRVIAGDSNDQQGRFPPQPEAGRGVRSLFPGTGPGHPYMAMAKAEKAGYKHVMVQKYYIEDWVKYVDAIKKPATPADYSPEQVIKDAGNQDVAIQGCAAINDRFAENIYATMEQGVAPLAGETTALRALVTFHGQARLHGHNAPLKGYSKKTDMNYVTVLEEWGDPDTSIGELDQIIKWVEENVKGPLTSEALKGLMDSLMRLAMASTEPDEAQQWVKNLQDNYIKQLSERELPRLREDLEELAQALTYGDQNHLNEWRRFFKDDSVLLDRVYPDIGKDDLIVLAWKDGGQKQALCRVDSAHVVSTSLFNLPVTATHLTFEFIKGDFWSPLSMAIIRSTTVYLGSELITNPVPHRVLAEEPLTNIHVIREGETLATIAKKHAVSDNELMAANNLQKDDELKPGQRLFIPQKLELELDGIYDGLQPGHWITVTGTRTDIPVEGREAALIKSVQHRFAKVYIETGRPPSPRYIDLPGDLRHTFVTLATPLNFSYIRESVRVNANVVPATHGETVRGVPPRDQDVILGSGDGTQAHQRFELKLTPARRLTYLSAPTRDGIESTLEVFVNNVLWKQVSAFLDSTPTDHVYTLQTEDDGKAGVIFGDGLDGARLPTGRENVFARYRAGIGRAGNVKVGQISLLATRPAGVKDVRNPLPASGGTDPENRDQARGSVKSSVRTLDRLVGLQDYADFARTFAGIGKARAKEDGEKGIIVWVAGVEPTSLQKGSTVLSNLKKALDAYDGSKVNIEVELYTPLLITLNATVWIASDHLWEKVRPAIDAALLAAFGYAKRNLGQEVALSEVVTVIQQVPGVEHVQVTRFEALTEEELREQALNEVGTITNGKDESVLKPVLDKKYFADKLISEIPTEATLAFIEPAVPSLIALKQP